MGEMKKRGENNTYNVFCIFTPFVISLHFPVWFYTAFLHLTLFFSCLHFVNSLHFSVFFFLPFAVITRVCERGVCVCVRESMCVCVNVRGVGNRCVV